jgi:hypothetical protein
MRLLCPIVQPATGFLLVLHAKFTQRRAMGSQKNCHELTRGAVPLQCFSKEFQCCFLAPFLRQKPFQHLALVIHSTS